MKYTMHVIEYISNTHALQFDQSGQTALHFYSLTEAKVLRSQKYPALCAEYLPGRACQRRKAPLCCVGLSGRMRAGTVFAHTVWLFEIRSIG